MQMCLWQFVVLKGSFRLPPIPALWCSHWYMQGVLIPLLQSVGKFFDDADASQCIAVVFVFGSGVQTIPRMFEINTSPPKMAPCGMSRYLHSPRPTVRRVVNSRAGVRRKNCMS